MPTAPPLSWVAPRIPMAGPGELLVALQLRAGDPGAHPLVAAEERLGGPDDPGDEGRDDRGCSSFRSRSPTSREPCPSSAGTRRIRWSHGSSTSMGSSCVLDVQALEDLGELELGEILGEARERQLVIVVVPPADGDRHDQGPGERAWRTGPARRAASAARCRTHRPWRARRSASATACR